MKRITSLLVGIAAIAISAVSAFAQAPDGPAAIPTVSVPGDNEVLSIFLRIAAIHPWLATAVVVLGSLRTFLKPLFAYLHKRVEEKPTATEAAWLARFENSVWWGFALFLLDWTASVKPTVVARAFSGSGKAASIILVATIPFCGFVGCVGSSPERIALNANSVAEDSIDAALKAWSISVAARERSADAMQATAPAEAAKRLVAINDEKLKVAAAKEAFALAEQAAIKGWLSARQTTNAPVSTLSNSLEAAKEPFLSLLRQLSQ